MSKLLEDFETIAGYKPYGCNDIEQLWNIRVIELLPEVDWEALKKALTELERLQDKEEMYYKALCKLEEASNMSEVRKILNEVLT